MSELKECSKCGSYWRFQVDSIYRRTECGCREFLIEDEDGEEYVFSAHSPQEAVERWAIDYNEDGDYALMGRIVTVSVSGVKYNVWAEPSIDYSIKELDR